MEISESTGTLLLKLAEKRKASCSWEMQRMPMWRQTILIVPPHTKYLCGHLDSCTNPKKDALVTSAVWRLAVVGAGVVLMMCLYGLYLLSTSNVPVSDLFSTCFRPVMYLLGTCGLLI